MSAQALEKALKPRFFFYRAHGPLTLLLRCSVPPLPPHNVPRMQSGRAWDRPWYRRLVLHSVAWVHFPPFFACPSVIRSHARFRAPLPITPRRLPTAFPCWRASRPPFSRLLRLPAELASCPLLSTLSTNVATSQSHRSPLSSPPPFLLLRQPRIIGCLSVLTHPGAPAPIACSLSNFYNKHSMPSLALNDSFSSFPLPTMVCPLFYSLSSSLE